MSNDNERCDNPEGLADLITADTPQGNEFAEIIRTWGEPTVKTGDSDPTDESDVDTDD